MAQEQDDDQEEEEEEKDIGAMMVWAACFVYILSGNQAQKVYIVDNLNDNHRNERRCRCRANDDGQNVHFVNIFPLIKKMAMTID